MTVGELRKKLADLPENMHVVAYRETENDTEFYGIEDVGASAGTPSRDSDGKPQFKFENNGPVKWLFIQIGDD